MKKKKKGFDLLLKQYKDIKISVPLLCQILLTEAVFIFAIVSLFEPNFLSVFYIIVGLTLLVMAYNNYIFFKKKYFNSICLFFSVIYIALSIYFIVSTIIGLFR